MYILIFAMIITFLQLYYTISFISSTTINQPQIWPECSSVQYLIFSLLMFDYAVVSIIKAV